MNGPSFLSDPLAVLSALGLALGAALFPLLYSRWNHLRKALRQSAPSMPAPSAAEAGETEPVSVPAEPFPAPSAIDPTGPSLTDLSLAVERLSRAQESRLDSIERRLAAIESLLAAGPRNP